MNFLSKTEIEEKNRKFRQLEDSVGEFYAKNGDQIVSDMKTDRGLPSAMRGTLERQFSRHELTAQAADDMNKRYYAARRRTPGFNDGHR